MGIAGHIVANPWFQHGITAVIVLNAIVIGLDTSESLAALYGTQFSVLNQAFLVISVYAPLRRDAYYRELVGRYPPDSYPSSIPRALRAGVSEAACFV
ncbi:MAG: hypothetical protein QF921_16175 [Pseudomonadales bacterium]|nr:hypothetical protein [Pseudomonadales bacterium]MDP6470771.1 hypothetical protein [Pseudomonadales bacterium]MDP6828277.1 hypothetical protein [Pseudomonadales bacterium]MDP6973021.1 hypothetical protein [Pseudomonadales bacterium]